MSNGAALCSALTWMSNGAALCSALTWMSNGAALCSALTWITGCMVRTTKGKDTNTMARATPRRVNTTCTRHKAGT